MASKGPFQPKAFCDSVKSGQLFQCSRALQSKRGCFPPHTARLCWRQTHREMHPCLPLPRRQETRQIPSKASGHQLSARIYPAPPAGLCMNPPRFPGPGRTSQTGSDRSYLHLQ